MADDDSAEEMLGRLSVSSEPPFRTSPLELIGRFGPRRSYSAPSLHQPPLALFSTTHQQKLTVVALALINFTSYLCMSILAPFFPGEALNKGVSEFTSGLIFGFYALVIFLSSPFLGMLLPYVGERFLFLSGIFLGGGCTILFGVLDEINDPITFSAFCFVVRGFEALGTSCYLTASFTILANEFPDSLAAVFGFLETTSGLGMTVGPAIGGFLYTLGGYKIPFFTVGGIMLLSFPITWYLLPEDKVGSLKESEMTYMKDMLKIPSVIVIAISISITASLWGFLDPTLEPHLKDFDLSPQNIGLMFLLMSAFYGISSPLWGWVTDKLENSSKYMIVCGLLISSLAMMILGPTPLLLFLPSALWLNIVSLIILGISESLALIPTFECLLLYAYENGLEDNVSTYGLVAGIWSSAYSLGEVVGPSLGGYLLGSYGFGVSCTVMGAVSLFVALGMSVFFAFEKCLKKSKARRNLDWCDEKAPLLFKKDESPDLYKPLKSAITTHASSNNHFIYGAGPRQISQSF